MSHHPEINTVNFGVHPSVCLFENENEKLHVLSKPAFSIQPLWTFVHLYTYTLQFPVLHCT
jgi:hypothetical protein